jgi:hypothetical protein
MAIDYERNKKYFSQPSPKIGIGLIVIGLLLTIGLSGAGKFVGILGVLAGAALLYVQFADKPSDADIDSDAANAIADVQMRALNKLGLDLDEVKLIEPVIVHGFYYKNIASGVQIKQGQDRVFRSSNYEGIALFFSEHQLHAYKFQFSLVSPDEYREQTDEYFYKDVVSVATQSETFKINDVKGNSQQVNFEEFKLTTTGGTSITSSIRDEGSVSRVISGARNLIREKKIAS